jgi:hypothetical protein
VNGLPGAGLSEGTKLAGETTQLGGWFDPQLTFTTLL